MEQAGQRVAVIGGGPAGLMAADVLRAAGHAVDLYDAMGSVGRKFLLAGKGGLNLTHSEASERFVARYAGQSEWVGAWLQAFGADALRDWARGFGIETFVGSSGRVFPVDLKAAPLLRGWVRRLRERGVQFHTHHRWRGWNAAGALHFETPRGDVHALPAATVLALGGASWPELGSDGAWVASLAARQIDVAPLQPANCGFECDWSERLVARYAGAPVKPVRLQFVDLHGVAHDQQGEFIVTAHGIEGSLVYALSAPLRDSLQARAALEIRLDLTPDKSADRLTRDLSHERGARTLSDHLRRRAGIDGVKAALLHEALPHPLSPDPATLAAAIKSLPITLRRTRPIAEAISTAGGVTRAALDDELMLRAQPGVFCAGEMLDWEAPTGGYLLTACFASGLIAGRGAASWLAAR